jgi:hypothetical protein
MASFRSGAATIAIALCTAAAVCAQGIWVGGGRFWRTRPRWATASSFDGSFNFCRGYFTSSRREDGGSGWDTDYPGADNNFSVRLGELTRVRVRMDDGGQPDYVVVRLSDPLLFRCPMVYMEDVGTVQFTEDEVAGLRSYLLKGGFLSADDFWGTEAWAQWTEEIGRVLRPANFRSSTSPRAIPSCTSCTTSATSSRCRPSSSGRVRAAACPNGAPTVRTRTTAASPTTRGG